MTTLKKDIIFNFSVIPSTSVLEGNHIILVTALGLISGDIITENESDVAIATLYKVSDNFTDDYRKETGITGPLDGNDGFISLKNVSIKSGNTTTTLQFLNVFYDQIIGVTIGKI